MIFRASRSRLLVAALTTLALTPLSTTPAVADVSDCGAAGLSVSPLHGPRFYTDLSVSPQLRGAYAGYRVTDTSDANRQDLWVEVTDFTGGSVNLGAGQAAAQQIPSLGAGQGASRFWYLTAGALTTQAQSHTVTVWTGRPDLSGSALLCSASGGFSSVDSTIKAAANKLTSVAVSGGTPKLGATFTVTVQGNTGTIGQGTSDDPYSFWMSPSALASWPAHAFRLVGTSLSFNGGDPVLDILRVRDLSSPDKTYTAVYTFRAIGFTSGDTGVYPVQQIASGTQIKHTDMPSAASLPAIAPATNDLRLSGQIDPAHLPDSGGTARVTIDVTGTSGAVLDDFTASLPPGASLVPGSATWNGAPVLDPDTDDSALVFQGPWTVTGQDQLGFDLELPGTPGDYAAEVVGHVGTTQIDTTVDISDDEPVVLAGNVNSRPVAEDDTATVDAGDDVVVPVLDNDTDADNNPLTVTDVQAASHGTASTDGTSVTYHADYPMEEGWDGVETLSYSVSDSRGGDSTGSLTVTVSPPPPAEAHDDSVDVAPGENATLDVLGNDRGAGVSIVSVSGLGATISEDHARIHVTAPTEPGEYTLTYVISDELGKLSEATVTLTVPNLDEPEPTPLQATTDEAETTAGVPVAIPVLDNDGGDGLTIASTTDGGHGTTVVEDDGTLTYTPDRDFVGTDTFHYTVGDAHGGTQVVAVTVRVDEGPHAQADEAHTAWSSPVAIDVLGNDPAGSEIAAVTVAPSHGTATVAQGRVVYEPDRSLAGPDSFAYRIVGSRTPATVDVSVGRPTLFATDDQATTTRLQDPVVLDVLDNDTGTDLAVDEVTQAGHGTVEQVHGGVSYTPDAGFTGQDSFDYTVSDVVGERASATVVVTVSNLEPTLKNLGTHHVVAGQSISLPIVASDPDGDHLQVEVGVAQGVDGRWAATERVHGGTTGDPGTGTARLRLTTDPAFSGSATVPLTLSDGHGGTDHARVRLVVHPRPVVGVTAGVVANPEAKRSLRSPQYDVRRPVSKILATRVDSRVVWRTSATASVASYAVRVNGVQVCTTTERQGPRQSCVLTGTVLRPGDSVRVVAVGQDEVTSSAARVPVHHPGRSVLVAVVYFPAGEFTLDPSARSTLSRLGTQAADAGYRSVIMDGHTDGDGTDRFNLTLSRQRSAQVAEYLRAHTSGVRVSGTHGFGESRPTLPNVGDRQKAANRRVEVYIS